MRTNRSRWPELKKLGRKQFILRVGVLGWGLPVAVLFSATMAYQHGWSLFLAYLLPALVMFPLVGILYGAFMWFWLERRNASLTAGE